MKKILLMLTILAFSISIHVPAIAQVNTEDQKEVVMDAAEAGRKAIIAANLNFTDEESKVFWPIYNQYRKDVRIINEALYRLIEKYAANYESLSDELATELMLESMDIEENRMILKRIYVEELVDIVPMKKVAMLYQIENKINALAQAELAETIPFVRLSEEDDQMKTE